MTTENNNNSREKALRIAAFANTILWILAMFALIIIMQKASSPKGLLVILAAGLSTALAVISTLPKQA